ncbi:acyl-CoA-associated DUF35 OB-fold domain-containing protein [Rhodococcus sp. SMB37]|uniref:Zn-ribbon domain-containing OB-fold protein n=1 Tax=Rhodococcus sp. SMB37 TaxID=2512213 RepID=UPI001042D683|nr:OB-fold domain-containing protein [Rhodococcus sp. SMB37]TCN53673.1 acyl-CoA-associated DUF35 OB-fold domain-containing protein [Rhodococcus sp. SMB37]
MTAPQNAPDWLLHDELSPDVDNDPLAPMYEGSARGELVLPFCTSCLLPLDLEQPVCDGCGSLECVWRVVAPVGTVHSSTVMHRAEPGLVRIDDPYPIIDVELASGHRLIMTTLESTQLPLPIDAPVRVAFRNLGKIAVPAAQPTAPAETEASS